MRPVADAVAQPDTGDAAGDAAGVGGETSRRSGWHLERRRLYLCTPDRADLERFVAACIDGGVDLVQLREKHLGDRDLVRRASLVARVCADAGIPFVLNDRPDLAVACGADGVHVGQEDTPPAEARLLVGDDLLVGRSTHAPDELERAVAEPVDYVSAGPVVPTPTKPGRPGTGAGYAGWATGRAPCTVWVTGGVTPESVGDLVASGARHFVVVRWLTEATDPAGAARRLRVAVDAAVEAAEAAGGTG